MEKRSVFLNTFSEQSEADHVPDHIIVQVTDEEILSRIEIQGLYLEKSLALPGFYLFKATGEIPLRVLISQLSGIDGVLSAELDTIAEEGAVFTPNDTYASTIFDLFQLYDIRDMWDIIGNYAKRYRYTPQNVAIVESGINIIPDLDGNIILPAYITETNSYTDALYYPTNFHGAQVANVIAAKINNENGIFGLGIQNNVFPLIRDIASTTSSSDSFLKAAELGYRVINYSSGGTTVNTYMEAVCAELKSKNVILCACAHNDSSVNLRYPARYDTVWGISGTDNVLPRTIELRANYGPGVDFCAPFNSYAPNYIEASGWSLEYQLVAGTSFSSPAIAALAANILSINPKLKWQEVKDIIAESCIREEFNPDDPRPRTLYGYGMPQFSTALQIAIANTTPGLYTPSGDKVSQIWTKSGEVTAAYKKVNGVAKKIWTAPPKIRYQNYVKYSEPAIKSQILSTSAQTTVQPATGAMAQFVANDIKVPTGDEYAYFANGTTAPGIPVYIGFYVEMQDGSIPAIGSSITSTAVDFRVIVNNSGGQSAASNWSVARVEGTNVYSVISKVPYTITANTGVAKSAGQSTKAFRVSRFWATESLDYAYVKTNGSPVI